MMEEQRRAGRPHKLPDSVFDLDFKSKSIKLFGFELLYIYYRPHLWWMRWRGTGAGLHWKNTKYETLLFSERYGYKKGFTIGSWRFKILPRGQR